MTLNYALQVLFYEFVNLTKSMRSGWICRPCFMDLWVLDYTLQAYEYVGLTLNYVLRAMADGSTCLVF